jgi:hypothetical protein
LYVEGGGRCTCARGENGSEVKNLEIQASVLKFKSVGFSKGEHIFWCGITESSDNPNVSRRRADKLFKDMNVESRALANSLMVDNGYQEQFEDVSMPADPESPERLGFNVLPAEFEDSQWSGGEAEGQV